MKNLEEGKTIPKIDEVEMAFDLAQYALTDEPKPGSLQKSYLVKDLE